MLGRRTTVARRLAPSAAPGPSTFSFPSFTTVPFLREAPDSKRNVENTYYLRNMVLTGIPNSAALTVDGGAAAGSNTTTATVATRAASDALATANRRLLQYEDLKGFVASDELFTSVLLWNAAEGHYAQCAQLIERMGAQQRRPIGLPVFAVLRRIALHTLRFFPQAPYSGMAPRLLQSETASSAQADDDDAADVVHPTLIGLRAQFADAHLFQRMWRALPALGVRPSTAANTAMAADDGDDEASMDGATPSVDTIETKALPPAHADGSGVRLFLEEFTAPDIDAVQVFAALIDLMACSSQVAMDAMNVAQLMECVVWVQYHFGSEARRKTWLDAMQRSDAVAGTPATTARGGNNFMERIGSVYVILAYGLLVAVSRIRLLLQHAAHTAVTAALPSRHRTRPALAAQHYAVLQDLSETLNGLQSVTTSATEETVCKDISDASVYVSLLRAQLSQLHQERGVDSDRTTSAAGSELTPFPRDVCAKSRFSSEELDTFQEVLGQRERSSELWQEFLTTAAARIAECAARNDIAAAESMVGFCVEELVLDHNGLMTASDSAVMLLDFLKQANLLPLQTTGERLRATSTDAPTTAAAPSLALQPNTCAFVMRALLWATSLHALPRADAADAGLSASDRAPEDDRVAEFRDAFLQLTGKLVAHDPVVIGDAYAVALEGLMDLSQVLGDGGNTVHRAPQEKTLAMPTATDTTTEAAVLDILNRLASADAVTSETIPPTTYARLAAVSRDAGWCEVSVKLREMRTMLFF